MVATCEEDLGGGQFCDVQAIGRCATCGKAFCTSHRALASSTTIVNQCASCLRAEQEQRQAGRMAKLRAEAESEMRTAQAAKEWSEAHDPIADFDDLVVYMREGRTWDFPNGQHHAFRLPESVEVATLARALPRSVGTDKGYARLGEGRLLAPKGWGVTGIGPDGPQTHFVSRGGDVYEVDTSSIPYQPKRKLHAGECLSPKLFADRPNGSATWGQHTHDYTR